MAKKHQDADWFNSLLIRYWTEKFGSLLEFQYDMEDLVNSKTQEIDKEHQNLLLENYEPIESEDGFTFDYREVLAEDWHKHDRYLTQDLRYTFFILLYTSFESILIRICELAQTSSGEVFDLRAIKGKDDLSKMKSYLKKAVSIELDISKNEWATIRKKKTLRNLIVHYHGYFDLTNQKVCQCISDYELKTNNYERYLTDSRNRPALKSQYRLVIDSNDFIRNTHSEMYTVLSEIKGLFPHSTG